MGDVVYIFSTFCTFCCVSTSCTFTDSGSVVRSLVREEDTDLDFCGRVCVCGLVCVRSKGEVEVVLVAVKGSVEVVLVVVR